MSKNIQSNQHSKEDVGSEYLNLFDVYEYFPFEWSLVTNMIRWQTGTELLLGDLFLFETGDQLINRMDIKAFEKRVEALHNLKVAQKPYELTYELLVHGDQFCTVCERGRLINAPQGYPVQFSGALKCIAPPAPIEAMKQGRSHKKDTMTGSMHRQALIQELDNILKQGESDLVDSAFIHVRVNRMFQIGLQYGLEESQKIIKKIAEELKGALRTEDKISRLSGNSFGIILHKSAQQEIVVIAKRIVEAIEFAGIRAKDSNVPVQIAIGGTVIRSHEQITPEIIIHHSERALMDAVNIKKMALPTSFVSQRMRESDIAHNRRKDD